MNTLAADIFPFGSILDPLEVRSASQYIILSHLTRPLVSLSKDTQIEGNLAESWEMNSNYTQFKFKIKKRQKFSNGDLITPSHVVGTIQRQIKNGNATHYDFSLIKNVYAEGDNVVIELNSSDANFIMNTYHPEFGVLHESDYTQSPHQLKFSVTSGPYVLSEKKNGEITIASYPNYTHQKAKDSPDRIVFVANNMTEKYSHLESNETHFAMFAGGLSGDDLTSIDNSKDIQLTIPHIGFSYWVTIDPRRKVFSHRGARNRIQWVLSQIDLNFEEHKPFWTKAQQIYLPDGGGRLNSEEVKAVWDQINSSAEKSQTPGELRLLVSKSFPFKKQMVEKLKKSGVKLETVEYANQDEFEKLVKSGSFDLFQINNDFSSIDLLQNLIVTFQMSRPLIVFESTNHSCHKMLSQAKQTSDKYERYDLYKKIEREILLGGYAAPIAYNHVPFVHSSKLDISKWSTLFPEVSFWKASFR